MKLEIGMKLELLIVIIGIKINIFLIISFTDTLCLFLTK